MKILNVILVLLCCVAWMDVDCINNEFINNININNPIDINNIPIASFMDTYTFINVVDNVSDQTIAKFDNAITQGNVLKLIESLNDELPHIGIASKIQQDYMITLKRVRQMKGTELTLEEIELTIQDTDTFLSSIIDINEAVLLRSPTIVLLETLKSKHADIRNINENNINIYRKVFADSQKLKKQYLGHLEIQQIITMTNMEMIQESNLLNSTRNLQESSQISLQQDYFETKSSIKNVNTKSETILANDIENCPKWTSSVTFNQDNTWNYNDKDSTIAPFNPANWGYVSDTCKSGHRQSPINLPVDHTTQPILERVLFRYTKTAWNISNVGDKLLVLTPGYNKHSGYSNGYYNSGGYNNGTNGGYNSNNNNNNNTDIIMKTLKDFGLIDDSLLKNKAENKDGLLLGVATVESLKSIASQIQSLNPIDVNNFLLENSTNTDKDMEMLSINLAIRSGDSHQLFQELNKHSHILGGKPNNQFAKRYLAVFEKKMENTSRNLSKNEISSLMRQIDLLLNNENINRNYIEYEDIQYDLENIVIHSPSEHTISGTRFAMELQIYHRDGSSGNVIAVSLLFKINSKNEFLDIFLNDNTNFPESGNILNIMKKMNLSRTLPFNRSYILYTGSETSPPCKECVRWIVMRSPIEVSMAQIKKLRSLMKFDDISIFNTSLMGNVRPEQNKADRMIFTSPESLELEDEDLCFEMDDWSEDNKEVPVPAAVVVEEHSSFNEDSGLDYLFV